MNAMIEVYPEELSIRAVVEDIRPASAWLEKACSERGVPSDQSFRLDLCLNEALANIISHAGSEAAQAPVCLSFVVESIGKTIQAKLFVSDAGAPFNPLTGTIKPRAETLAEAEPGGLGLNLMNCYSDDLDYEHRDGRNHLTFIVRWHEAY